MSASEMLKNLLHVFQKGMFLYAWVNPPLTEPKFLGQLVLPLSYLKFFSQNAKILDTFNTS